MAPTLRSGQTSKTADNHAGVGPSTIPGIDTPETANNGDSEAVEADNPNDTRKEIEASTTHNQEVIDRQPQQIQYVHKKLNMRKTNESSRSSMHTD